MVRPAEGDAVQYRRGTCGRHRCRDGGTPDARSYRVISWRIVAEAFIAACRDELEAPKPGNVHVYASGHRMTAAQFVDSAAAAADPLCAPGTRVGARTRGAVEATLQAVGANTNLGIVLLCAPLAAAVEREPLKLRDALVAVLDGLDIQDAEDAF